MAIEKIVSELVEAVEELIERTVTEKMVAMLGGLTGITAVAKAGKKSVRPDSFRPSKGPGPRVPEAFRQRPYKARRAYSEDFKRKLAAEAKGGPRGTIERVAKREKLEPSLLGSWVKAYRASPKRKRTPRVAPRQFTDEFKAARVAEVKAAPEARGALTKVAKRAGIASQVLSRWIAAAG